MNNYITEYPAVSDKRLEEKIKRTADEEDVSIFLELARMRNSGLFVAARGGGKSDSVWDNLRGRVLLTQLVKVVDELEWQVRKENNNLYVWEGLRKAKMEGLIGGYQLALFNIRKYVPEVEEVYAASKLNR